jgi:superfamily II DNA or RNA helicase
MEVKTDKWVLPNRIGYNENIFKTFRPEFYFSSSKNKLTCNRSEGEIDDKKISLFPQQRLIRDYMNIDSPYRGALLYHELGAGKSGASIAAAEGYINKKKMFVLSPASLAVNYENEIIKISSIGLNLKKDWTLLKVTKSNKEVEKVLNEKYSVKTSIIKRDGLVWIPLYEDDIPNAIVIKKTVDLTDKTAIDVMISHIIRNRYTFISYNGLTQKLLTSLGKTAFDNSFVIIDEVHNFASRIVNGSKLARDIYTKMLNAKDCKILLLSGTPIINNPYEIATIINLVRGYMTVYELNYSKTSKTITEKDFKSNVKLLSVIDEFYIDNDKRKIFISLLPYGYKQTETELQKEAWDISEEKAIDLIIDNINSIQGIKLNSKYTTLYYSSLPNSKEEFDSFFIDTTKEDTPKIKNADLFMRRILGTVSYYSISGSELFPRRLPDITHNLPMTNNQFKRYLDVRAIERKMEAAKGGVMDDKTSVYRAFSRMVCNFSFPEEIERLYPNDIKKAMKKELDEDETASQPSTASSTSKGKAKAANVYEEKLKEAITKIKKGEILSYENVKKNLSPKFAQMYDDIETSPGSVLVYSQFRLVEGLGLLTEFLSKNGFKEIDLKKQDGKFYLSDKEILEPIYDNKRYVIFNQDKEKTRILMNLFNGDFANLPKEIQEQLPKKPNQLYGELVKVFCITASGAEGISLKNVRRVLITEPYWNNIRIEQVIGRAIRSCSHESLPLKDRDVCVYRYLMTFTKKQLEKDYSIETLDKRLSTDEHISQMAEKKSAIVNQFLQMLKISSFDCIINAEQNKPLKNNYKCFSWALGVNKKDLAYTMDIKDDYKIMKHRKFQMEKKGKGRVIIKKGVKYVLLDGKIYNYHSYKNAGILIPEVI